MKYPVTAQEQTTLILVGTISHRRISGYFTHEIPAQLAGTPPGQAEYLGIPYCPVKYPARSGIPQNTSIALTTSIWI